MPPRPHALRVLSRCLLVYARRLAVHGLPHLGGWCMLISTKDNAVQEEEEGEGLGKQQVQLPLSNNGDAWRG